MTSLNEIKKREDLAYFLGIPVRRLLYILYGKGVEKYYVEFTIPKKSGKLRTIHAPNKYLKFLQRKIAKSLVAIRKKQVKEINISHGFERKKSIITNAKIHRNKKYVLNIDLENFFDSFNFGRVRGFFIKNRAFEIEADIATLIAQLCCCNGVLPQGAPTSPVITNLICQIMDNRILKIAKNYKLDYTRYADDLTFSTNDKSFVDSKNDFLIKIEKEINRAGFTVNSSKTNFFCKDYRQVVTGLVVNEKLNVPREYYKNTRAMANSLYTTGKFHVNGEEKSIKDIRLLEGRFSYINQLEWHNNTNGTRELIEKNRRSFSAREKEYQKLLFYKYFYANDRPLIVTEGKTDITYIKAALRSLYKYYPELITKDENGIFHYKIAFLKRSRRFRYFFGLEKDGADSICKFYNNYIDGHIYGKASVSYFDYFQNNFRCINNKPIIFLLDNEFKPGMPIQKFVNTHKIQDQVEKLKRDLHIRLRNNYFLVTVPLVKGKDKCEIEDLFSDETRNMEINGKTFSTESNFDNEYCYGKEMFSKEIFKRYREVDFGEFPKLLNVIKEIIKNK